MLLGGASSDKGREDFHTASLIDPRISMNLDMPKAIGVATIAVKPRWTQHT